MLRSGELFFKVLLDIPQMQGLADNPIHRRPTTSARLPWPSASSAALLKCCSKRVHSALLKLPPYSSFVGVDGVCSPGGFAFIVVLVFVCERVAWPVRDYRARSCGANRFAGFRARRRAHLLWFSSGSDGFQAAISVRAFMKRRLIIYRSLEAGPKQSCVRTQRVCQQTPVIFIQ